MPGLKALSDWRRARSNPEPWPRTRRRRRERCALVRRRRRRNAWSAGSGRCTGPLGAALAFVLVLFGLPLDRSGCRRPRGALLDFRPILRNRSALAYSIAYCVHTWRCPRCAAGSSRFSPSWPSKHPARDAPDAATVASVMGFSASGPACGQRSWPFDSAVAIIVGTMLSSGRAAAVIGFGAALPYVGARHSSCCTRY